MKSSHVPACTVSYYLEASGQIVTAGVRCVKPCVSTSMVHRSLADPS